MNDVNSVDEGSDFQFDGTSSNVTNEPVAYNSFYTESTKKRRNPLPSILFVLVLLGVAGYFLYTSGRLTPKDPQEEFNKLSARACTIAIKYAQKKYNDEENTAGTILYVSIRDLVLANKIEETLTNALTSETIPLTTDIRLEVSDGGSLQCHGFVWPGDDTEAPYITLIGDATIMSTVGTPISDFGATAEDDQDGDITKQIERSGSVNINMPGMYVITYVVSDRAGNVSDPATRTYIIQ